MTHVLAHQGGWDEILLVAVPLVVLAALLLLAGARAKRVPRGDDAVAPDALEDR